MSELWDDSSFYGESAAWLESLYETYLSNPDLLESKWRDYFDALAVTEKHNGSASHLAAASQPEVSPKEMHEYFIKY